jgi:Trypsin-like peptidase domain
MNIDWHQKASAGSVGESAAVLLRSRRGGGLESTLEAMGEAAAAGASERERLDRLGEALATAQPVVPEGDQARIKEQVLAGARSGLAKMYQGESTDNFTLGEHVGLEAVILTNGERPSLFVRDGFIDLNAPDIGDWSQDLGHFQNEIRKVITSVGRIDVPVKPWFAGTCFVITEGLVLTNRHVLEEIATQDAAGGWTLKWSNATSVNFVGEDGAAAASKFNVTGVAFAGPDPINRSVDFAHLDMAILRVDPTSDTANAFPKPVTFEIDVAQPGARRDMYVVGFPGQPKTWQFGGTPPVGQETTHVISTVFNNKFGVKRLAPGSIKAGPGEVPNDGKSWICTHDASTLGGNSGSCVADLSGDGFRIVALHFAGANRDQNWAHVAARLHEQLSTFSATFVS